MLTDAVGYISDLWLRFIPHFGVDELLIPRLKGIPDQGTRLPLGNTELVIVPAHFMHSAGNFQVYDPVSKTLFSGDLGASIAPGYVEVTDFDAHIPTMEGFHHRYMPSESAHRLWAAMVRQLDIERIVPQHGAIFPDRETSGRFIDWVEQLPGAASLMQQAASELAAHCSLELAGIVQKGSAATPCEPELLAELRARADLVLTGTAD